jgi:hypothetical protein
MVDGEGYRLEEVILRCSVASIVFGGENGRKSKYN